MAVLGQLAVNRADKGAGVDIVETLDMAKVFFHQVFQRAVSLFLVPETQQLAHQLIAASGGQQPDHSLLLLQHLAVSQLRHKTAIDINAGGI